MLRVLYYIRKSGQGPILCDLQCKKKIEKFLTIMYSVVQLWRIVCDLP